MRIIVTGSRRWVGEFRLVVMRTAFTANVRHGDIVVVGDEPNGADAMAMGIAQRRGLDIEVHRADWQKYGRAAGPIRNNAMVAAGAGLCLAFPLEGSIGTFDMMRRCRANRIPIKNYGEDEFEDPPF